ncbi:hypothetical protein EGI26_00680 [Lacihabitans sp. CCS-44]|uniref:hypothetical protein n=1 Tax=Lacihabitans sp. CCS-44 TaxID=2487331 RepID=UPI0020CEE04D|nr:hypothetical protein [Lacihabitans sp. CCS-44]MCP9753676.1 hypothetical protein [Lacihabitans sp. CCS-44]
MTDFISTSVLFITGVYTIYSALSKFLLYVELKKNGQKTIGKIIDIKNPEVSILSDISFVPIISFSLGQNKYSGIPKNAISSNPTFYKKEQIYDIYYQIENPNIFVIDKNSEGIGLLFLFTFGIALCYESIKIMLTINN